MNADTHSSLPDNIEARIVAWVLGEASAFEIAELERTVADQPALAAFKRRIEAVHGLVGEASRPALVALRLSPERRAKVLAAIGSEPATGTGDSSVMTLRPFRRRPWFGLPLWAESLAAVLVVGLIVFAVVSGPPRYYGTVTLGPERREPSATVLGPAGGGGFRLKNSDAEESPSLLKRVFRRSDQAHSREVSRQEVEQMRNEAYRETEMRAAVDAGKRRQERDAIVLQMPSVAAAEPAQAPEAPRLLDSVRPPIQFGTRSAVVGGYGGRVVTSTDGDVRGAPAGAGAAWSKPMADSFGIIPQSKVESQLIQLSPFEVTPSAASGYISNETLAGSRVSAALSDRADAVSAGAKQVLADQPSSRAPARKVDESLRVEQQTDKEAISTFSLHVSDVSYQLAQTALAQRQLPDPASVRPEEFYNAFDYADPAPAAGEPVAARIEQARHPFLPQRNLVRVAVKVPAAGRAGGQPLQLTVLLDTSGSMVREDRALSVRRAFDVLASLLGENDRVTLIGFARQPRLLADRVPGNKARELVEVVGKTPADGGTNLEEALKLATEHATDQFDPGARNRIVVLTDGAANLGNDNPEHLAAQVATLRQKGIAFDACGVGTDGLDDTILEALTRKGDGRYYVVNSPDDADAGFAQKLAGAFRPAAENVKAQVRFNPARVRSYRLIGFEQHRLRTEDFRNDKVDAAELAAEEAAVALYQVELQPDGEGELGDVFVRFRHAATGAMVERSWTLPFQPQVPAFDAAPASIQLAGTSAFLAEKLRGGPLATQISLRDFGPIVNRLRGAYSSDARVQEFVTMFEQARRVIPE